MMLRQNAVNQSQLDYKFYFTRGDILVFKSRVRGGREEEEENKIMLSYFKQDFDLVRKTNVQCPISYFLKIFGMNLGVSKSASFVEGDALRRRRKRNSTTSATRSF